MATNTYTNGQIALPAQLCHRLGIHDGDSLDVSEETGRIVLTPLTAVSRPKYEARIITDPITGFPVITLGPDAPVLTSEQVADMLKDFP
jgi:AbrB family looped-hinge helix DNA binding protein